MGMITDQTIVNRYAKLLKKAISDTYGGDFKNSQVSKKTEISQNKLTDLFKNSRTDRQTLNVLSQYYGVVNYEAFCRRIKVIDQVAEKLLDKRCSWVSYRLNSTRRLYEALWKFSYDKETGDIKVVKKTNRDDFEGRLTFEPDFTININLKSKNNRVLKYISTLPYSEEAPFDYTKLTYLMLDVMFVDGKETYTTSEILARTEFKKIIPRLIRDEIIEYIPDVENGNPTNPAYLAYNFLTRYSSKSRHLMINDKINTYPPLSYKHDIFISCPVGAFRDKEQEFYLMRDKIVKEIINTLIENLKFKKENIYCEIQDKEYGEIYRDDRQVYFNVRQKIMATHYIALIPEEIGSTNSGVYLEVYFRILKKLPAYIFYNRRRNFPSLMQGIIKDNKAVNVTFEHDYPMTEVAGYINEKCYSLFQFNL